MLPFYVSTRSHAGCPMTSPRPPWISAGISALFRSTPNVRPTILYAIFFGALLRVQCMRCVPVALRKSLKILIKRDVRLRGGCCRCTSATPVCIQPFGFHQIIMKWPRPIWRHMVSQRQRAMKPNQFSKPTAVSSCYSGRAKADDASVSRGVGFHVMSRR